MEFVVELKKSVNLEDTVILLELSWELRSKLEGDNIKILRDADPYHYYAKLVLI